MWLILSCWFLADSNSCFLQIWQLTPLPHCEYAAVLLLASSHSCAIKSAVNRASTFNQGEHSCSECSIASCIIFLAPFNSSSYLCLLRLDVRSGNSGLSFGVEFSFWCRWYQLNSRSKFWFHCVVFCNLKRKKHQIWQVLDPCRPTLARSKGSM